MEASRRPAVPDSHGHIERRDYEYIRQGTANLFVVVEPLVGWRHITPTTRRTQQDYAYQLQWLADTVYPHAQILRLVEDNLNIHGPAALYATFPAAEAHRLRQRFEFHATPKHGSWLNMAETLISIVRAQLPLAARARPADVVPPSRRARSRAQCPTLHHPLAIHDWRRPHQITRSLPSRSNSYGLRTNACSSSKAVHHHAGFSAVMNRCSCTVVTTSGRSRSARSIPSRYSSSSSRANVEEGRSRM